MSKIAEKNVVIDDIDREILNRLEKRGRASYMELASAVALSPNAVAERVRRLVHSGAIRGFSAQVDPVLLGLRLAAFIDVKLRSDCAADDFERALEALSGVVEVTLTTGQFDYTLRVACRDQADLVRIVEYLRTTGGAAETYSRIVLRDRRFPLTHVTPRSTR